MLELKGQPLPACRREAQAVWCCPGTGPWRSQHLPTWPTKEGPLRFFPESTALESVRPPREEHEESWRVEGSLRIRDSKTT